MSYNAKNYTEQGGDKTVIGGTLEIKEGATVIGLDSGSCYVKFSYDQETEKWSADKTVEEVIELYKNNVPVYAVIDEPTDSEYFSRSILHMEYLCMRNDEIIGLKFATSTNWNFTVTVENGEWKVNLPE